MESNDKKRELCIHSIADARTLSGARLAQIIHEDKPGSGLRSRIPYVYVWNDDRLYIVSRISFPARAASGNMDDNVVLATDILRALGYEAILCEAVFHSMHMSDPRTISKEETWWGMNNVDKFKQR
ncbi:hypothetical protein DSECCO2_427910 [anaerobic digester metagenome]